ncbi:MAG: hypothetical protein Q9196_004846 [Gyalolechia fulgens]
MDSRFASQPSAQDYSHHYPPSTRQPAAPSYAASHRLPPTSTPPSHTLPPLSSHNSAYTYSHDPPPQRAQNGQPLYFAGNSGLPLQNDVPAGDAASSFAFHLPFSVMGPPNDRFTVTSALPCLPRPSRAPKSIADAQRSPEPAEHSLPPTASNVCGFRGRRGILPSASGRPAAVANGSSGTPKTVTAPVKDADGKFPCEHCNKNYLHAKHLKRHLLRHTGVRPYSCGLCEDTFSRSDILKRHFQKCSVRRGNPTGASHLTHSKNSKKSKPNPIEHLSVPLATSSMSSNPTESSQTYQQASHTASSTPTLQSPLDLQGLSNLGLGTAAYQEELQSLSNPASRANSIKRSSNGMAMSARTTSGPSSVAGPDSTFAYSTGQVTPDSLTTSGAATPYSIQHECRLPFSPDGTYHTNNGSGLDLNSISRPHSGPAYTASNDPHIMGSANGSRNDLDLSLFSTNAHDDFNQQYPGHHDESHDHIKSEHDFSHVQYPIGGSYSSYISKS